MKHLITSVDKNSPADALGIRPGDYLVSLCGTDVIDVIDYEQLTCTDKITCVFESDGELHEGIVDKDEYEPFGLGFESSLMSPVRQCKNHCIFCFIDQMHTGGRKTLHFKDDDWRLSLIMGNYVTLTNVDDAEFERIIARRVSPLYISVHATDGEVRKKMMRNPTAVRIRERLSRLRDERLKFHCQIVLCPGINDGEVLKETLSDLYSYAPYAQSVAVVPVGLTKYREGLFPLRTMTRDEARETIAFIEEMQKKCLAEQGTRFVFPSDEMYIEADLPLPAEETYEDYPQIENGVGLLRKFEYEFLSGVDDLADEIRNAMQGRHVRVDGVTGVSAYPFLQNTFDALKEFGIELILHPIENDFFGHTITVSGLVTAGDIINQLAGQKSELLLLPHTMVRENTIVMLDGKTVEEISQSLHCRAHVCPCYDGGEFIEEMLRIISEELLK